MILANIKGGCAGSRPIFVLASLNILAGVAGDVHLGGRATLGDGDEAILPGAAAGPRIVAIPTDVEGHGRTVDLQIFRVKIKRDRALCAEVDQQQIVFSKECLVKRRVEHALRPAQDLAVAPVAAIGPLALEIQLPHRLVARLKRGHVVRPGENFPARGKMRLRFVRRVRPAQIPEGFLLTFDWNVVTAHLVVQLRIPHRQRRICLVCLFPIAFVKMKHEHSGKGQQYKQHDDR